MPDGRFVASRVLPRNPRRMFTKGFWAILDQGLFAGSNFLLSVSLARWLPPSGYGAFTVAFAVFLLLGTFHSALLTEPMVVFGPARYKACQARYLTVLQCGHWGLVALGSALLALAAQAIGRWGSPDLASALNGFALAAPFMLLLWLMRRICAMRHEPHLAASGGVLYLLVMTAGLFELSSHGRLSVFPALAVMGVASLAASLWLARRLRLSLGFSGARAFGVEILRDHWRYGRWSIASLSLTWARWDLYYLLLPLWGGLQASAALKAVMNLILPVQHANTALAVLLVPALVRTRGGAEFGRLARLALTVLTAGSIVYWLLLAVFQRAIISGLYGGQYDEYGGVVWMLGFVVLTSAAVSILGASLRALERPHYVFWSYGCATIVSLGCGAWFSVKWGVGGAVVALALASAVNAAAMWICSLRSGGWDGSHAAAQVVNAA